MTCYRLGSDAPRVHPSAFIHPQAVLIGDVVIGPEASVWPCAVLRADFQQIRIGARSSVQDGTVLHTIEERPTVIGNECAVRAVDNAPWIDYGVGEYQGARRRYLAELDEVPLTRCRTEAVDPAEPPAQDSEEG